MSVQHNPIYFANIFLEKNTDQLALGGRRDGFMLKQLL
jgi:hypothetical protein